MVQAALTAQTLVTDAISAREIACALAFRSERMGRPFAAGVGVGRGPLALGGAFPVPCACVGVMVCLASKTVARESAKEMRTDGRRFWGIWHGAGPRLPQDVFEAQPLQGQPPGDQWRRREAKNRLIALQLSVSKTSVSDF